VRGGKGGNKKSKRGSVRTCENTVTWHAKKPGECTRQMERLKKGKWKEEEERRREGGRTQSLGGSGRNLVG